MKKIFFILITLNLFALDLIKPLALNIDNINISDYLVSEKLDGVRGFWDGKNLYSKNENLYYPPNDFIKNFPPFEIDGELYCDADFEDIISDIKNSKFKCVKLYVFEVPNQKGNLEQRLQVLRNYLKNNPNDNIRIIPQLNFKNKDEFLKYFDEITKNGAEGVVLHKKYTEFSTKKGDNVIKFKKYFDDECIITKVNYVNDLLKNYECKWNIKNAQKALKTKKQKELFSLKKDEKYIIKIGSGFNKEHRENPLKIGTKITIKYYKLSKNLKPVHAVFIRVRKDD